jgi:multidrug resistance efflux pump
MRSADITDKNVVTYLQTYQSIVSSLSDHFSTMKNMFVQNIEDARYKTLLTSAQNTFTALQTKNSSINASITSQLNSIRSYFSSYEDQQQSLEKQIQILREQIALTKKQLDDAKYSTTIASDRTLIGLESQQKITDLSTQSSQNTYDFVKDTQPENLAVIKSNLANAQVSLQESLFNQSKLRVNSPVEGVIADIYVDIGQEVSI